MLEVNGICSGTYLSFLNEIIIFYFTTGYSKLFSFNSDTRRNKDFNMEIVPKCRDCLIYKGEGEKLIGSSSMKNMVLS